MVDAQHNMSLKTCVIVDGVHLSANLAFWEESLMLALGKISEVKLLIYSYSISHHPVTDYFKSQHADIVLFLTCCNTSLCNTNRSSHYSCTNCPNCSSWPITDGDTLHILKAKSWKLIFYPKHQGFSNGILIFNTIQSNRIITMCLVFIILCNENPKIGLLHHILGRLCMCMISL